MDKVQNPGDSEGAAAFFKIAETDPKLDKPVS
jgi:hypothetical protein